MTDTWTVRKITSGTDRSIYHWHGYYDIPVFDDTGRFIVGHRVSFQGRTPGPDDTIRIGLVDLQDDSWQEIGESKAWNWQQASLTQWIPKTKEIIWNDRDDGRFVSRIFNTEDNSTRTLPYPVYALCPDGRAALTLDFSRLDNCRRGYGYSALQDSKTRVKKPVDDGVWKVDLTTGEAELLLSIYDAVRFIGFGKIYFSNSAFRLFLRSLLKSYRFWFNHIKISPDSRRFTVKCRYRPESGKEKGKSKFLTHSLTAGLDGSDIRYIANNTSHVMWKTNKELYLWRRNGLYVYEDNTRSEKPRRQLASNAVIADAHVRFLPKNDNTFVFDEPYNKTIPLYIYNEETKEKTLVSVFENHVPEKGEYRCDLHACPSPDGKRIVVSSLQDGGRQIYIIESD